MVVNRVIKEIADDLMVSVDEISSLTRIPAKRVNEIISYYSSATPSEAFTICKALGVDLGDILKCY